VPSKKRWGTKRVDCPKDKDNEELKSKANLAQVVSTKVGGTSQTAGSNSLTDILILSHYFDCWLLRRF